MSFLLPSAIGVAIIAAIGFVALAIERRKDAARRALEPELPFGDRRRTERRQAVG